MTVELKAPAAAAVINLRNDEANAVTVQLRVFKWRQEGGQDRFEPTRDVVASPPMIKLAPGAQQVIRVVRTAKSPPEGQESYRLFVDEVPDQARQQSSGVTFLLRHSIPVFFSGPAVGRAEVAWTVSSNGRQLNLRARNAGSNRLRVSQLLLRDEAGKVLANVKGLAGYVLPGAERYWRFTLPRGVSLRGRSVSVTAEGDAGPIRASASVR